MYDIVSHYNGFQDPKGNGADRTQKPWRCETLSVSILNLHTALFTTISLCGYCGIVT